MNTAGTHEDFTRAVKVRGSTDRGFGLIFSVFFLAVGLWPLRAQQPVRWFWVVLAATVFATALIRPALLRPLNRLWMQVGLWLGRLTSPVITGLLFYAVFTPAALMLRVLGKDPLRLRAQPEADTYWIPRRPPGPGPQSMLNQF